jgi:hypothetical protein
VTAPLDGPEPRAPAPAPPEYPCPSGGYGLAKSQLIRCSLTRGFLGCPAATALFTPVTTRFIGSVPRRQTSPPMRGPICVPPLPLQSNPRRESYRSSRLSEHRC